MSVDRDSWVITPRGGLSSSADHKLPFCPKTVQFFFLLREVPLKQLMKDCRMGRILVLFLRLFFHDMDDLGFDTLWIEL